MKHQNDIQIVIVGRPNVGKSTLFNRLIGRKKALVHDLPGVTRDRVEEKVTWQLNRTTYDVRVTDTGGIGGDRFGDEVDEQVELALESASVVLFVVDSQTGLTPADQQIARKMSENGIPKKIPVVLVVNKIDSQQHEERLYDFYTLGFDTLMGISAEHDRGVELLKEWIVDQVKDQEIPEDEVSEDEFDEVELEKEPEKELVPRIAIVGRPNAGKSTLVNALLGEKRMITSPIAGTTIDSVDTTIELGGRPYIIVDTAGIRRKAKTEKGVEVLSVVMAKKALDRCHLAILMLDGETGITDQDEKIGGLIEAAGPGVILAVNKWDTQKQNPGFKREDAAERIRAKMAFLRYAPILFISAKEETGLDPLPDLIDEILTQRQIQIPTKIFTEWVRKTVNTNNPNNAKFYLCHQTGKYPPTFVLHVNDPKKVHFSLERQIMNGIREKWGYMGSPIRLLFRKGKNSPGK